MQGAGQFPVANTERILASKETQFYGLVLPCKVSEANYQAGKIKVVIHEGTEDSFVTEWIPWVTPRAGNTREWNPPEVGEKGLIISPTGRPKNGYFLPATFYVDAQLPSKEVDIHKIIYLHEEVGLFEYNRRSGRKRWRIHSAGEYRHEIGIFEKTGDIGTSDVIQTKDYIQLRVGETRLVIADGLFRFYMVNTQNEVVELKLDFNGLEGRIKETGIIRLTDKEASLGILQEPPHEGSQSTPVKLSGLIASTSGAQLTHADKTIVKVDDEINLEHLDVTTGQSAGSRLSITSKGTRIQANTSAVTITQEVIDSRVSGSSITLTPAAIVYVAPEHVMQKSSAPGNVFQGGSGFKFNTAKKLPAPQTPKPPEVSKQFKPFMPD